MLLASIRALIIIALAKDCLIRKKTIYNKREFKNKKQSFHEFLYQIYIYLCIM